MFYVLELDDIELQVGRGDDGPFLLRDLSLYYPANHFGAIVGPSGCGKSTLLKVMVGLFEPTDGRILWSERDLCEEEDLHPTELGYVPQFSIFHPLLTVRECVCNAVKLRVGQEARVGTVREHADHVIEHVGLEEIADRRAKVLSGGQQRRLGLALELVSNPSLLLCDEVTSGLDPKSEDEIVQLLRGLTQNKNRIVLSVTHSLRHLDLYDSVTVLYQGRVAYHGAPEHLLEYFGCSHPDDVFPSLAGADAGTWGEHWDKCRESLGILPPEREKIGEEDEEKGDEEREECEEDGEYEEEGSERRLPNPVSQFLVLFFRRWKLFFRDMSQVWLQIALLLVFPAVVVLFAYDGLPDIKNLSLEQGDNVIQELKEALEFQEQTSRVGSLVSGLIMLQVVLLALIGSNNSQREIAGERLIFEKEKLSGLGVGSYIASKACFLVFLVAAQSLWMTYFVKNMCGLPGYGEFQGILLFLVTAALTATCLAISAWSKTAEQASLISIYLVGFQLPLSGSVLPLPEAIGVLVRPFIAAYWSWSGYIHTMKQTRFYDLVTEITNTPLEMKELCGWVLVCHVLIALFVAALGASRSQWD